nr:MAG TPA: DNA-directed RNA polymerase [Caudoviricetes sp.]
MKLISLTCPNCNANLDDIDSSRPFCYCQYCGTKIALDDGTIRKETHIYDEAKIKETESSERVKMREMDVEREHSKQMNEILKYVLIFAAVLFVVGIVLAAFDVEIGWYIILFEVVAVLWAFEFIVTRKNKKNK